VHLIYLHGFASSPASSKAQYLAARASTAGFTLHCPGLNEPDFSTLTVSRMIAQVERVMAALDPGPVALIGSSLGAFVALHVADRRFAAGRAHATLRLFDDDHQLQAGLKEAWREVAVFLGVSESGEAMKRL